MIPTDPSEQCAHAKQILEDPMNWGFFPPDLTDILVYWLDLETEVLKHHSQGEPYLDPGFVDYLPSIRLARWIMKEAGCDSGE